MVCLCLCCVLNFPHNRVVIFEPGYYFFTPADILQASATT
jgi:hypothetical protein